MIVRPTLLGLLSIILIAAPLHAEDSSNVECADGQFIKRTNPIRALQEREVDAIQAAASEEMFVAEETKHITLIVTEDSAVGLDPSEGEIVGPNEPGNPCVKLRKAYRAAQLDIRRGESRAIVRKVDCECNGILHAEARRVPNDSMFGYQWGVDQANDVDMNMPEAWGMCIGSSDVVVAIIDTGIDYNHPDLTNAMWRNPGEIPGNYVDDDRNGVVDDVYGYNAVYNNGNPLDDQGHGSHVAGTIGAQTDNSIGVAGVAWNTKLMASKFLDSSGSGYLSNAIKAIDYVTDMKTRYGVNVRLTNNSWGGGGFSLSLQQAIERARDADILFVAAAGNSSINMDSSPQYPASYPVDNIISVGAVDSSGNIAYFSNFGASTVAIGAPGVNIASSYKGGYSYLNGTSMAAPHVSGALALLQAFRPGLTYLQMKNTLLNSARRFSSLNGKVVLGRFVDAYAMLLQAPFNGPTPTPTPVPPTPTPTVTPTITPTPTPTLTPTMTPTPIPGYFSISGRVASNGVGIPGARIILRTAQGDTAAYAASDGGYKFLNVLGPLSYTLIVNSSGYSFNQASGYLNSDRTIDFAASVNRYAVEVTVKSPQGSTLSGVIVDAGSWGSGVTDAQGRISFMVNYGAEYSLTPTLGDYIFSSTELRGQVQGPVERIIIAIPRE